MRLAATFCALFVLLAGCSRAPKPLPANRCKPSSRRALVHSTTKPVERSSKVVVENVALVQQKLDFSGEAAVEMGSTIFGRHVSQDRAFELAEIDPAFGRGIFGEDLVRVVERLGFEPGPAWFAATSDDVAGPFADLQADLASSIPSIVCLKDDDNPNGQEEFRLIVGYDPKSDEVLFHDSNRTDGAYAHMPRERFIAQWTRPHESNQEMVMRVRLAPKSDKPLELPAPTVKGFSQADYAQHVISLKKNLRKGLTVVVEPPFVVIGNDHPDNVQHAAEEYVRRTVELLEKDFFNKRPSRILNVWLFTDSQSYTTQTQLLLGRRPTTPYGYYSSENSALVMNISTGAGTLVHEMVHPYIEANVPECPTWINEGLASLYERPGEENGHIWGYPNWRLPSLQQAINDKKLPSFSVLASMTSDEFYQGSYKTNYAQSRYVFYYLQQKGLLVTFYRTLEANIHKDPTGYHSLVQVLGEKDMAEFQKRWEQFVLEIPVL